jgi:ABC-type glycerol-3-phosphate transport system substrate-binding protein
MNVKKVVAVALAAVAMLGLAGCGASAAAKAGEGNTVARYVDLPDGGQVLCVFWVPVDNTGVATAEGAQISCGWGLAGE